MSERNTKDNYSLISFESIIDYLTILLRYKYWIIIPTICVGILSTLVVVQSKIFPADKAIIKPKYISYTKFIMSISINSQSSSYKNAEQEISDVVGSLGINIKGVDSILLAEEMIKSNIVIDPIIEKYNMNAIYKTKNKSNCRERFLKNINFHVEQQKIYPFEKKPVISVSFSDKDPELAKMIVEDLMKQLNYELSKLNQTLIKRNLDFLEKRIDEVTKKLINIETEMFKIQNMIDSDLITRKFADSHMSKYFIKNQTLKRKYLTLEKISEVLIEQYELNKMKYVDVSPIYIIEHAEVPEKKSNISSIKIILASVAAVFFLCILVIYTYYGIFVYYRKIKKASK